MSLDIQGSIPAPIQKQLKKEAVFGCVICGCPLLNYIHIIPPFDKNAFLPEDMAPSVLIVNQGLTDMSFQSHI